MKTSAPTFFTHRFAAVGGRAPGSPAPGPGQAEQFRQLILPHLEAAYNLARFLTRDPVLSEDIVQDSLLRALRGFGGFRGDSPRAWLLAIVRNCSRTALSASGGALSLVINESSLGEEGSDQLNRHPDPAPNPEDQASSKADAARVRSAIEAIPEPFREAVVLRDLEDLSYAEIAQVTGAPVGTVMSRLSRGRAMLAEQLLPPSAAANEPSRSVK